MYSRSEALFVFTLALSFGAGAAENEVPTSGHGGGEFKTEKAPDRETPPHSIPRVKGLVKLEEFETPQSLLNLVNAEHLQKNNKNYYTYIKADPRTPKPYWGSKFLVDALTQASAKLAQEKIYMGIGRIGVRDIMADGTFSKRPEAGDVHLRYLFTDSKGNHVAQRGSYKNEGYNREKTLTMLREIAAVDPSKVKTIYVGDPELVVAAQKDPILAGKLRSAIGFTKGLMVIFQDSPKPKKK